MALAQDLWTPLPVETASEYSDDAFLATHLYSGDALDTYALWPEPHVIVSDGAYGVGGFPGDPRTADGLADWYRPHIAAWSARARRSTTLWFWNTEVGWATVHPVLVEHGWEYVQAIVWDKGIAHVAGNVNGDTIRQFPVVTEVCIYYRRRLEFPTPSGAKPAKEWLQYEWRRAGLPLHKANEACGVKNAATRKYLTQDWLWYFPPPAMMERLVGYANRYGRPDGRPYYAIDGRVITSDEWASFRHDWTHEHAVTNVWAHPPLNGQERYRGNGKRSAPRVHPGKNAALHLNQKPLAFMRRILAACTAPGQIVWEPFGGLCSAAVAAIQLDRQPFAAEIVDDFRAHAADRLLAARRRRIDGQ
jgi:hypothetical protein